MDNKKRCAWCDGSQIYTDYHDNEWGRAVHDDRKLFEMFVLESFQAGLSWITILKKRAAFKEAFDDFDVQKIALYDENKIAELMKNENIVRNKLKINAAIGNAKLFIKLQKEYGSFDNFIWSYVEFEPIVVGHTNKDELPASTPLSDKISSDLKKLGFKFMGTTIVYSFMQAVGIVNDHTKDCYLYGADLSLI